MKTVTALKSAEIFVNGESQEVIEVKNPCQMWKNLKGWQEKYGTGVRIIVTDAEDKPYKDFTVKVLKNGKTYMVNAVKETNRVQAARARKAAAEAAAKLEAKRARKREYERARRARLKAQKTQD